MKGFGIRRFDWLAIEPIQGKEMRERQRNKGTNSVSVKRYSPFVTSQCLKINVRMGEKDNLIYVMYENIHYTDRCGVQSAEGFVLFISRDWQHSRT
jgi:hypothetical protein